MDEDLKIDQIVVADIGGTNARFAIASFTEGAPRLSHAEHYACSEAGGVQQLLHDYLGSLDRPAPSRACLASAGPGDATQRHLTNLNWNLNAARLAADCGLEQVMLVNDFEALARGAAAPECAIDILSQGTNLPGHPRTVVGPGTGLGAAAIHSRHDGSISVIATEAAHMRFAPADALEAALAEWLAQSHAYVHVELLLSGPGLRRLHRFLHTDIEPNRVDATLSADSAAEITARALAGERRSLETVRRFLAILGGVAGDIALAQGARGGVLLGGGILPRLVTLLETSDLLNRFHSKGALTGYMRAIPVGLITDSQVAERGAALLFQERVMHNDKSLVAKTV